MAATKRPPGSARAREAKRKAQAAERARKGDFARTWLEKFEQLGEPPDDLKLAFGYVARGMLLAFYQTLVDPGLAPEKRVYQLNQLAGGISKVLNPAELGDELRELKRALEELKARRARPNGAGHGGEHAAGDPGAPPPGAALS